MKALSIRQPWAWLVANGHKDIENRDWATSFRGRFLIHAAKSMTRDEYEEASDFAAYNGVTIPAPHELERGGIVGEASIIGCVDRCNSLWFFGRYGFELADAKPLPFQPMKGQLGFFEVEVAQ
ncbi:ASCH domain-containing protein [Pseudomonas aeruginosa]|uniref:ASCH domain-containing protein n=1 Tax=Pseudomonas aeruginosa TaxID=287 RepID=UPI000BB78DC0|nr:ASCH domain-containing protein [Pseudomonas aeruginosa]EKV2937294.1 ASCH domain-containing protein [Pseudomonas aeruginosa]ELP1287817.1 ASCH domain-containing protein [Pseudomonas aeruginosa]PBW61001.1 hypothetical protein CJU06_20530 [Pseudomonas aeruginosa]HDL4934837.1 ASCH domain-containing protein [Pseudomonas aeruginosa]